MEGTETTARPASGLARSHREAANPSRVLSSIDVGSNSVKLLVARLGDDGRLEVLAREKAMIRLGHETLQTGRLSEKAIAAGAECIGRFAALARAAGAERLICAATCAVREARNGDELARRVKQESDVDLEVISGEEEARLITRAVRSDFTAEADPILVIDIGGGSTEIILSAGKETTFSESVELGAVRLTDRFVATDPIEKRSAAALRDEVDARLKRPAKALRSQGFRTAVGTSGTIAALAELTAALEGRALAAIGHRALDRKSLEKTVKTLVATTEKEKLRLPGLDPRRADILTAGGLLLLGIMERLRIRRLLVCDRSLREGLILDVLDHTGGETQRLGLAEGPAEARDVRRESVRALAKKTGLELAHANNVTALALLLFDATHALHQLAGRERDWLEHAAFLHDIGATIGYERHHRHSEYLITHGGLAGFAAEGVHVIAQVARYHRKARPKDAHEAFASLDPWLKPVVEKLAALLRIADGLDRSRRQLVRSVDVTVRRRKVVISVAASGDPALEVWAAKEKAGLFSRVFGRRVEIVVEPIRRPVAVG